MMRKYSFLLLLAVLAVGVFLRVFGINASYGFEGELGRELIYLRSNFLAGRLPLAGLTTSHEWLSYGPFYYWIMMPIFAIFKGDPFILFWTALGVSILGLILNYAVVKKIVDQKTAFISTLFEAISPLLVWQTRLSKLHVFFFILMPVFMYLSYLVWNEKKKWVFWLGLVFGFMFSFHFSQIPIIGVIILMFWIKKNIYSFKDWLKFAAGTILPNVTLLWQDKNLILWLPYRTLNITDKNPVGTLTSLSEFFGRSLFWDSRFWILGFVVFILLFGYYVWLNRRNLKKDFLSFYLTSSLGLVLTANILHGGSPVHYFLPIFSLVPIFYAIFISKIKLGILLPVLIFALNFSGYFGSGIVGGFVAYQKQLEAANFIISDANGKKLSIERSGQYDYFPEQYSQNYKYLILWKGGYLVENSTNVYKIVENNGNVEVEK